MTNAISIASTASVPQAQPGAGQSGASPMGAFLDLLTAALAGDRAATPGAPLAPAAIGGATEEAQTGIEALFDRLTGLLEDLAADLKGDLPLDPDALDNLQDLLSGLETALAHTPLPALPPEKFARLAALGESFGISLPANPGNGAPHDLLSGLFAKLAHELGEDAPELATQLTALTRRIDTEAAALQSKSFEQQAIAVGSLRRIESETRLNPAAALAAAQGEAGPDGESAGPLARATPEDGTGAPPRSLSRPDAGEAAAGRTAPSPQAANQSASGTSMPAADLASADADLPDGLTLHASQANAQATAPGAAARPEAVAYQRPEAHVNFPHISVEISRHIQNGVSRFEIKLNPAELGRIDVRMEMDGSGNVIARLAVERSETLDLLQRDQRALMRALAEAGIDTGKTDLEFSLRQEGGNAWAESRDEGSAHKRPSNPGTETQNMQITAEPARNMRGYARLDAVSLWV